MTVTSDRDVDRGVNSPDNRRSDEPFHNTFRRIFGVGHEDDDRRHKFHVAQPEVGYPMQGEAGSHRKDGSSRREHQILGSSESENPQCDRNRGQRQQIGQPVFSEIDSREGDRPHRDGTEIEELGHGSTLTTS